MHGFDQERSLCFFFPEGTRSKDGKLGTFKATSRSALPYLSHLTKSVFSVVEYAQVLGLLSMLQNQNLVLLLPFLDLELLALLLLKGQGFPVHQEPLGLI